MVLGHVSTPIQHSPKVAGVSTLMITTLAVFHSVSRCGEDQANELMLGLKI